MMFVIVSVQVIRGGVASLKTNKEEVVLRQIIDEYLKPFNRQIDENAYSPKEFLNEVGKAGFFHSDSLQKEYVNCREMYLIEETAKYCMTTAFTLWCHLAALASVRLSNNPYILNHLLPSFESGKKLGGTGLSNALKFYAGLENIRLEAERADGGFIINGSLPSVSNLNEDHWFVILASLNHHQRIMCLIPVKIEGLGLESKTNFVGINGSATHSCSFHNVYVPDNWIITEEADSFIQKVRPTLVLYQIPLGIGVSIASIKSIKENHSKDIENNQLLKPQPKELIDELQCIRERAYTHCIFIRTISYLEENIVNTFRSS